MYLKQRSFYKLITLSWSHLSVCLHVWVSAGRRFCVVTSDTTEIKDDGVRSLCEESARRHSTLEHCVQLVLQQQQIFIEHTKHLKGNN